MMFTFRFPLSQFLLHNYFRWVFWVCKFRLCVFVCSKTEPRRHKKGKNWLLEDNGDSTKDPQCFNHRKFPYSCCLLRFIMDFYIMDVLFTGAIFPSLYLPKNSVGKCVVYSMVKHKQQQYVFRFWQINILSSVFFEGEREREKRRHFMDVRRLLF